MISFLDKTTVVLLLALLVFTALAHGAVEPWSVAIGSVMIVGLLFVWGMKTAWGKTWELCVPAPFWPLLALLGLGLLQSVAWTDQAGQRLSLSLDVEATRETVLWLSLLLIAFVVAANILLSRERLGMLATFFTCFGLALAFFALLQQATWNGRFYWFRVVNSQAITAPFGPFVHHGHYAGYLELLLPFPLAFLITQRLRLEKKLFYGFAATLIGVSVIASLARGGMITLAAQILFLGVTGYWLKRRQKSEYHAFFLPAGGLRVGTVLLIATAILVGVFWIGVEPVVNRIAQGQGNAASAAESFFNNRGWLWRDTITMFRAHPVIGVGLGAFETAFPIYSQGDGSITANAAHNDYLQILAEGGIIGGVLTLWFIVVVLRLLRKALHSQDTQILALALGSGTGIVGMLVHSIFDFNLQLPSHALLFLTLTAVVTQLGAKNAQPAYAVAQKISPPINYFEMAESLSKKGTL